MQVAQAQTIAEAVARSAAATPDKLAIRLDDTRRSYAEIIANAERRARQLAGLGLTRGDRFGILLPTSIEIIELLLAASMAGLVAVPINTRFKSFELHHIISHSGMKLLVMVDAIPGVADYVEMLDRAMPSLADATDPRDLRPAEAPALRSIALLGGSTRRDTMLQLDELPAPEASFEAGSRDDALLIMYTSGTTAKPKGCVIAERALLHNVGAIAEHLALTPDDIWWCPLPMFHVGGILFPSLMLAVGGSYLTTAFFAPDPSLAVIAEEQPTILYPLFPTITLQLMEAPRFTDLRLDRARFIVDVAPKDLQRRIQEAFSPVVLLSAFGMTESTGLVAYSRPDDSEDQRLGTCGRAIPGWEMRIVDPDTRETLPVGGKGELAIKGGGLFDRYLDDPEATARQFTADGFFLTGDAGMLDADGMLTFLGRLKDQLKVGGENVSALEVESFLSTHPAVMMAQVVGVADDKYGEVPAAFIELREGHSADEAELLGFCTGSIARFKIPRYVRFVTEWPMSATKIQKFQLKERLERELADG